MKLSLESDYALRIVLILCEEKEKISGLEIVKKSKVPEKLGLRILTKLVNAKILKSFHGKNGGYLIRRTPEKISIFDVVTVVEELIIKNCIDEPEECNLRAGNCSVCKEMEKLKNEICKNLKNISMKYLIEEQNKLEKIVIEKSI